MQAKTITVKSLKGTLPKGVTLTTMANEQYTYKDAAVDKVLNRPGVTANISFDEAKNITDAMHIAYNPDALKLVEKLDAAKVKTDALIKPQEKTPPIVSTPIKPPPNPMNKSVSISYAKDLLIAGKIGLDDLLPCAEVFYRYMVGELEVANLYPTLLTNTKTPKEGV